MTYLFLILWRPNFKEWRHNWTSEHNLCTTYIQPNLKLNTTWLVVREASIIEVSTTARSNVCVPLFDSRFSDISNFTSKVVFFGNAFQELEIMIKSAGRNFGARSNYAQLWGSGQLFSPIQQEHLSRIRGHMWLSFLCKDLGNYFPSRGTWPEEEQRRPLCWLAWRESSRQRRSLWQTSRELDSSHSRPLAEDRMKVLRETSSISIVCKWSERLTIR